MERGFAAASTLNRYGSLLSNAKATSFPRISCGYFAINSVKQQTATAKTEKVWVIFALTTYEAFRVVRPYGLYTNSLYRWSYGRIVPNRLSSRVVGQQVICPFKFGVVCPKCKGVMEPYQMEYIHRGEWVIVYF